MRGTIQKCLQFAVKAFLHADGKIVITRPGGGVPKASTLIPAWPQVDGGR